MIKDLFEPKEVVKELSYYNTNNESGRELVDSKLKALKEQNFILGFFQTFRDDLFTPDEVWNNAFTDQNRPLLTNVRRSITNLTKAGKLVKTDYMKVGMYGKKCHSWRAV